MVFNFGRSCFVNIYCEMYWYSAYWPENCFRCWGLSSINQYSSFYTLTGMFSFSICITKSRIQGANAHWRLSWDHVCMIRTCSKSIWQFYTCTMNVLLLTVTLTCALGSSKDGVVDKRILMNDNQYIQSSLNELELKIQELQAKLDSVVNTANTSGTCICLIF